MRKVIPSVLDHRQQGIHVVFAGVEKREQVGEALARVRSAVVIKDLLFYVLDRRVTFEAHKEIQDAGGKDLSVFDDAINVGNEFVHTL